jgi:hypothetical protein
MIILTTALHAQSRESLLKSVAETSNWSPGTAPVQYDEDNIGTLAGNRTPAILSYGFSGATVQEWNGPEGRVRLSLYEMTDPSAAYGLYALERDIHQPGFQALPLGTEGFRVSNRTFFWQSRYAVRLEGTASAVDTFGRTVSENIFGQSRKPPVCNHLPPENLVRGSEKYFVESTSISQEVQLDAEKLGFDDSVEVATAEYDVNGNAAQLVLLMYPTQQIAKKYADQWDSISPDESAFRKRAVRLLGIVQGTRDPEVAKAILDGVNLESQVTWNEEPADLSLPEVILTIFTFIGVALAFTIVVGVGYGGLRLFVKARYPNQVFDRPEDMEIIQLKLGQGVSHKELRR